MRVWAPACRRVDFVHRRRRQPSTRARRRTASSKERFRAWPRRPLLVRLDGDRLRPDPASRFQPDGPHGPSEVVDPAFRWTDATGAGVQPAVRCSTKCTSAPSRRGHVVAAAEQLPALADLGITVIEMMPVADFAGRFGWGYDGVNLYAPTRLYGTPDDLRGSSIAPTRSASGSSSTWSTTISGPDGNYCGVLARLLHRPIQERLGRGDQLRGPARRRCASSSSRTRATGSTNITSTASGSTRRRTSTTRRPTTSSRRSRARARERRAAPVYLIPRTNRRTRGWSARRRRLRPRCALERRLPPHRRGRADRPPRGLLHGLPRSPQEFISAAKYGYLYQGQWYAGRRSAAARRRSISGAHVHRLPRESRSGRELRLRAAAPPAVVARRATRASRR